MGHKALPMERKKRIALVAHDNTKPDLLDWAKDNRERLANHEIFATGSTGDLLEDELGTEINKLMSGPLGGDQQIGAKITNGFLRSRSTLKNIGSCSSTRWNAESRVTRKNCAPNEKSKALPNLS